MAQSFVTDAGELFIPGAYPEVKVITSNTQLATSGVIFAIGEADAGPDFSAERDLGRNVFGPDQEAEIRAKYISGNIVDAYIAATTPSDDDGVKGSFAGFIPIKTNISNKASSTLKKWDTTAYGTIQDRSYGTRGNLISYKVSAKTSEVVPTTGAFTALLPIASTNIAVRVNGGAAQTHTLGALETPTSLVSAINGMTGVKAVGGANKGALASIVGTLTLTVVSGNHVLLSYDHNFSGSPAVGDTMYISGTSALAPSNAPAAGSYVITGVTASTISATKLRDVTGAHNALTPPIGSTQAVASTNDVQVFGQVTIQLKDLANDSVTPIDGVGKALEIADLATGTGFLADIWYRTDGSAPVSFFSTTTTPKIIVSASEYVADLTEARQLDNVTNDVTAGGKIALALGYKGTTAQVVNDGTTLTFTVTGGTGSAPAPVALKDYKTIAALVSYLITLDGFSAAPGAPTMISQSPLSLDVGTYTICSSLGGTPGRIKQDGYAFYQAMKNSAILTQEAVEALTGLPAPTSGFAFLAGGTRGATTDATIQAALNKMKLLRGNFVVPLFSRDASADIADGLTDPASAYTIAGVHTNTRAHVLSMSTLKARRNRQAFLSIRDTFDNCQTVASNLANSRCSCSFQDVMDAASDGSVTQFQPWMAAMKAAAFQSAAFYQAIFGKQVNISGAVQAAADFDDQDDDAVTTALKTGLLTIRRDETGGFHWVSDQTTYGADNNFVYNSIQAVYASDLVALTTAQRMERAFVGRSIADISASLATSTLEAIMGDMLRLKLIAPSDDAPKGFRNAKVKIQGPAMIVSVEIKLDGAIYFIPITFQVTQVSQSA
jgi:hypothetical protein